MEVITRATELLIEFLQDADARVFALKGPWGVGKSYFVRDFLKTHREDEKKREHLPPFVSYASVFGLRTIREVQDVINGCFEHTNHGTASKVMRAVVSGLSQIKAKVPIVDGLNLPVSDFSNSAFWAVAKHAGILIVLDDLERAHKDLGMEQILGLASSLTENSKAKVLLIFNEDRLDDAGRNVLAGYREKAIDAEFSFLPDTREIVALFLDEEQLTEPVFMCLNAGEGPNIRLIQRINRATKSARKALESHNISFDDDDLADFAKIVWLFHVSPVPLTFPLMAAVWMGETVAEMNGKSLSDGEKATLELGRKVSLKLGRFDGLMLGFLMNGHFSEAALGELANADRGQQAEEDLKRRIEEAWAPFTNNFRVSGKEAAAGIERLLDDHVEHLNLGQFRLCVSFLEDLGRPSVKWWRRRVEAVAPKLDSRACQAYLGFLKDAKSKKIIQAQLTATAKKFDAKATLLRIVESSSWNPEEMKGLESVEPSFYREWFRTEAGDFLVTLRAFLGIVAGSQENTVEWRLHGKLVGVLQGLAKRNAINRLRLTKFFGLPLEALGLPRTAP